MSDDAPPVETKLRRRRVIRFILYVVLAGVFAPYFWSRAAGPYRRVRLISDSSTGATKEFGGQLKIVTYNIAHGRGATDDNWKEGRAEKRARAQEIANLLIEIDADVVVLNEVDFDSTWSGGVNQAELIAQLAAYPHRVEQRNFDLRFAYGSWIFGNAVLSRFPITDAVAFDLPKQSAIEALLLGCKRGSVCTIQLTPDQSIRLFPVHLEHRREETRIECARAITELARESSKPFLAAGDFNSTPTGFPGDEHPESTALDLLIESGRFQVRPTRIPADSGLTFSSYEPNRVIDWIMIPDSARFESYEVMDSPLSDHRPVAATLELR